MHDHISLNIHASIDNELIALRAELDKIRTRCRCRCAAPALWLTIRANARFLITTTSSAV